jgi:hypothetical protein
MFAHRLELAEDEATKVQEREVRPVTQEVHDAAHVLKVIALENDIVLEDQHVWNILFDGVSKTCHMRIDTPLVAVLVRLGTVENNVLKPDSGKLLSRFRVTVIPGLEINAHDQREEVPRMFD